MINRVVLENDKPMIEIWRDVVGYEGYYQVSNLGEVRSLPRYRIENGKRKYLMKGVILNQSTTTTGYKKVELMINGIRKSYKVHRLVAEAFIVNTYDKPFVNHKDGNPLNNIVDNLEWCTHLENIKHARETGLKTYAQDFVDHTDVIKDYLSSTTEYTCKKYGISKTILYGILKKHDIKRHRNVKYSLNLQDVLEDMKNGLTNSEIADKHNCSKRLIATRRCKFRKEGLL